MKITVDTNSLGRGQLWNRCTERYDILGLICKEAGLEDEDMNYRKCVVLKKDPKSDEEQTLPPEISKFFDKVGGWDPVTPFLKDSSKFAVNELGLKVLELNDIFVDGLDDTRNLLVESLSEGGIEIDWNKS